MRSMRGVQRLVICADVRTKRRRDVWESTQFAPRHSTTHGKEVAENRHFPPQSA